MPVVETLEHIYGIILSDHARNELENAFVYKHFLKEEIILNQGEVCSSYMFIEKGLIRLFYYKDGRDITEHFAIENDLVFAIESLFLKQPTHLMIEALEDCSVYELNYNLLKELSKKHVDISQLYHRILELDLVLTQKKADSWRFETSGERYNRFCIEYPEVVRRASIAHIATYLLMTPETLSRVRARLL